MADADPAPHADLGLEFADHADDGAERGLIAFTRGGYAQPGVLGAVIAEHDAFDLRASEIDAYPHRVSWAWPAGT